MKIVGSPPGIVSLRIRVSQSHRLWFDSALFSTATSESAVLASVIFLIPNYNMKSFLKSETVPKPIYSGVSRQAVTSQLRGKLTAAWSCL